MATAVLAACLHTAPAVAEPSTPLHLLSGGKCTSGTGVEFELPPGFFLAEPEWQKLDDEVKRLQSQEIRLTAENDVYKEHTSSWWAPLLVGIGVGMLASYK